MYIPGLKPNFSMLIPIPIIGGPKKPIPINRPIFKNVFVIMTITTILNELLFYLNIIHQYNQFSLK